MLGDGGRGPGGAGNQRTQTAADQSEEEVDDQVGADRGENVAHQVGGDVRRAAVGELLAEKGLSQDGWGTGQPSPRGGWTWARTP